MWCWRGQGALIRIYGLNEGCEARTLRLRSGVFTLAGDYPRDGECSVVLPPNASTCLAAFPEGMLSENAGAFAVLLDGSRVMSRNRLFLQRFKAMAWEPADVQVQAADGVARFSSRVFVWGRVSGSARRSAAGGTIFFDLYPGLEHVISWPARRAAPYPARRQPKRLGGGFFRLPQNRCTLRDCGVV